MAYTSIGAIQEGDGRDIGSIEKEPEGEPVTENSVPLVDGGLVMAGLTDGKLVQ